VRWSRPIPGTIKTVTGSKEAGGWYACCSCAEVPVESLPLTGTETGIDVGLTVLLVTADGDIVENPHHHRRAEKQLKKAQRRVSRRKKGSKRRRTAVQLLARKHQHIRRQRCDFHHKTALALVHQYDVISVEAIAAANVSRRPTPRPDENGTGDHEHNGASRKAASTQAFRTLGGATSSPSSLSSPT
jgi:putative transposase